MNDEKVVKYKASVEKDLRRIGRLSAVRLITRWESVLRSSANPGERLTGEFNGLFKWRMGDYRAIFVPTQDGYLVLRISHRREVYRQGRP